VTTETVKEKLMFYKATFQG